ncbi:MAG: hypothetical protein QGF59_25640, partial [Pirellulaceae bacterium]|nr:hypothetical protein [Pirellulaceae bacterium]
LAIEAKLEEAKTDNRVAAFKAEEAVKAAGVSDEVQQKLQDVASTQVKARGRITRPTALLVDKSASMSTAIELGKRIGSMISTVCEKNLFAYAFDTMAYEISPNGEELADWEMAFAGIQAGGCTSCGVPLSYMQRKKQYVEQIIMITDEQENSAPFFVDALKQYREATMADPAICLVRTPHATDQLQKQCQQQGMIVDVFQFTGDYYSLPNLIPMLTRPSKMELLMEIMDYPLPQRKSA